MILPRDETPIPLCAYVGTVVYPWRQGEQSLRSLAVCICMNSSCAMEYLSEGLVFLEQQRAGVATLVGCSGGESS